MTSLDLTKTNFVVVGLLMSDTERVSFLWWAHCNKSPNRRKELSGGFLLGKLSQCEAYKQMLEEGSGSTFHTFFPESTATGSFCKLYNDLVRQSKMGPGPLWGHVLDR